MAISAAALKTITRDIAIEWLQGRNNTAVPQRMGATNKNSGKKANNDITIDVTNFVQQYLKYLSHQGK